MSPPLILCSATLGSTELASKFDAAAAAGFDGVSVYGAEVRAAAAAGVPCESLAVDRGLMVAEVDGIVQSLRSTEHHAEALEIAEMLGARSITVVETGAFDPANERHLGEAAEVFGALCDRAAAIDALVHIEPFAWSTLNRVADVERVVEKAGRPNGGVLLDLWHLERGPEEGALDVVDALNVFGVQLADTIAKPGPSTRDECMTSRLLPGHGHGGLATKLAHLAAAAPLPPVGVEIFGPISGLPLDTANAAYASLTSVMRDVVPPDKQTHRPNEIS